MSAVREKAVDAVRARMQLTADVGSFITPEDMIEAIENAGLLVVDPNQGASDLLAAIFDPIADGSSADPS